MILHDDLDAKQLIKPPGVGGVVRSVSFIRGDIDRLEAHFYKDGVEVTGVTDIVAVIKEHPGEVSPGVSYPSLAQCLVWEAGVTGYVGQINLNGVDLKGLIGNKTSIKLLFELTCFHDGQGPITAAAVACLVVNDLWRGDEATPPASPPWEDWLEAKRPLPLELTAPPEDGVTIATQLGQSAIVRTTNASGTFEDIWQNSNLTPMTWQPPGNIFRDRDTGTLYRQFINNSTAPFTPQIEEAYPA